MTSIPPAQAGSVMDNVTASYLTLCGSTFGQPPRHHLVARSQAAARAGFSSIGACADELSGLSRRTMSAIAATIPVPVMELEWFDLAQPARHCMKTIFDAADAFGARRVNTGVCAEDWSPRKAITVLRAFAEEAMDHLLDVCVEPVAFGPLWDPREVMDLIDAAGQPNVGLLLDTWQMTYALHDSQVPFTVPWDRVAEIQLAGSRRQGHTRSCAMERCLPGHADDESGSLSWYRMYCEARPGSPVSVEVTNSALRKAGLDRTAQAVMSSLTMLAQRKG